MFQRLDIPDVVLVTPKRFGDHRGWFSETFKQSLFKENVADALFVQDNQSYSKALGTVRGLHYQTPPFAQGKLVRCLVGAIFDVAVDIRVGSPHFGQWVGATLTAERGEQLWVPAGFAHGFCTLTDDVEIFYKVTNYYSQPNDAGITFNDSALDIKWPIDLKDAILSDKDQTLPKLGDIVSPFVYSAD